MQLWDRGYWAPEGMSAEEGLRSGALKFTLQGERLRGSWVLIRMKHDRNAGGKASHRTNWLLIKHRDDTAHEGDADALLAEDRSVASGRAMAEIASGKGPAPKPFIEVGSKSPRAKPLPVFIEPQLCRSVDRPPAGAGWVHEIKFDGYRIQLHAEAGRVVLRTRKGLDWTTKFPAIAAAAKFLPDAILDGEIVALDENGAPDFVVLQAALSEGRTDELLFFAFDLLHADGADLRPLALSERKSRLQAMLATKPIQRQNLLRYVDHFDTCGEAVLLSACKMSLEGIVSKRLNAPYRSGRSDDWTKAKCRAGQEVVIGGWTHDGGALRSLLVGVHRGGQFVYVGRVGTGFDRDVANRLLPKLKAVASEISPFTGQGAPKSAADIVWTRPELVAEIAFAGWTGAGKVRQAAFKGFRHDKPADEVEAEMPAPAAEAEIPQIPQQKRPTVRPKAQPVAAKAENSNLVMGVAISHPDKPMWPDGGDGTPVSKLDLARYYEAIEPWMMPHIAGRPCSILRAPGGYAGEQFFQRHAMPGTSNLLELVTIPGDRKPYLQIDRIEGLAAMAQVAALELHPWNCAPGQPETPGWLIFDMDPAPDLDFDAVIRAAIEIREKLDALGLVSFCKTTGGKGLHVVTPLSSPHLDGPDWPQAKAFAREICEQMVRGSPKLYLTKMSKALRTGKIFLDYLRNDRLSTAVAPLSPRARPGATVSMPLRWNQIRAGLDPTRFTLRTAPALLAKSTAWQEYSESARPLAGAIQRLRKTA